MDRDYLILKRASTSRSSGEWSDDDYDVLADGLVVGRILKSAAAPVGMPWLWTLAYGHHEDRTPTYGYEPTRAAAMTACHGDGGEKGYSGNWNRLSMSTTVLAYLILFMGFITFLCGAFGVLMLLFEEASKTERVQFRYYAMVVGLISGGLGMIGIGQGLRLLLLGKA